MKLFNAIKQFFIPEPASFAPSPASNNPSLFVPLSAAAAPAARAIESAPAGWGNTSGRLTDARQNIRVTTFNDRSTCRVSGSGNGAIGKLTGSTFLNLAENLPISAVSAEVQIALSVGGGLVQVALCTPEGKILSDTTAPGKSVELHGGSRISVGRVRVKLVAMTDEATDVRYQVQFEMDA